MKIWQIEFCDGSPHWPACFIEAETADGAGDVLEARLADEDSRPETVYEDTAWPRPEWQITEAKRPLVFILGPWCR